MCLAKENLIKNFFNEWNFVDSIPLQFHNYNWCKQTIKKNVVNEKKTFSCFNSQTITKFIKITYT